MSSKGSRRLQPKLSTLSSSKLLGGFCDLGLSGGEGLGYMQRLDHCGSEKVGLSLI